MKDKGRSFLGKGLICGTGLLLLIGWLLPAASCAVDVDELIFQGADAHYKGNLDAAVSNFEAAVRLDPRNEFAHNQLGVLYAKKRGFKRAFKEFSIVTGLDERNTFAQLWLGILHLQNGDMNPAYERFQKVTQIDPNNADAYYFLGAIQIFRRNPIMAIEFLKKARDTDSEEADTHFRLAKAFHNMDMIANALLEYQRTLEIKPAYTKAINEIGWIYYNRGDVETAVAQWKKTLKLNSRDRDAAHNLAKAYNDLAWESFVSGKTPAAIANWKKAFEIDPGNKAAKYFLEKYGS